MDFAGPFHGKMYLVLIDAHIKWIEAFPTNSASSSNVIELLRTSFTQFALPEMVVTDDAHASPVKSLWCSFWRMEWSKSLLQNTTQPRMDWLNMLYRSYRKVSRKLPHEGRIATRLALILLAYQTTSQDTRVSWCLASNHNQGWIYWNPAKIKSGQGTIPAESHTGLHGQSRTASFLWEIHSTLKFWLRSKLVPSSCRWADWSCRFPCETTGWMNRAMQSGPNSSDGKRK